MSAAPALPPADPRDQADRWLTEGRELVERVLPGLLEEHERLRARAETAEAALARLQAEMAALHRVLADFRDRLG